MCFEPICNMHSKTYFPRFEFEAIRVVKEEEEEEESERKKKKKNWKFPEETKEASRKGKASPDP